MSEKEKLRDAVVEAAKDFIHSVSKINTWSNEAGRRLEETVRALDEAERPFLAFMDAHTGAHRVKNSSTGEIVCEAWWGTDERWRAPDGAALIARLLNEHFAKEQP